jgi:hypothetical protein
VPALCATGCDWPPVHGSWVCGRCETDTRRGLRELPGLYADLADPRRGHPARIGGHSADPPQVISDEARQTRSAIRACLVAWCLILAEDYAVTLPADNVRAIAHTIAVHAGRLLNSEHADQLVHDITAAASEARRIAYPGRHLTIACPCGGRVTVDPDYAMQCRQCRLIGDLTWWQDQAMQTQPPLVPLADLPQRLLLNLGIQVTVKQLRNWADRKIMTPAQRDPTTGRRYYDPIAVAVIAQTRVGA